MNERAREITDVFHLVFVLHVYMYLLMPTEITGAACVEETKIPLCPTE